MNDNQLSSNMYEKGRLRDRFRDLATLAGFTVAVAIISLVAMDLIIYPATLFAVRRPGTFTAIFSSVLAATVIALLVAVPVRRIIRFRRDELPWPLIARYLLRRPLHYLALFCFFLLISTVIITILYLLLSNNYYLLYRITSG